MHILGFFENIFGCLYMKFFLKLFENNNLLIFLRYGRGFGWNRGGGYGGYGFGR